MEVQSYVNRCVAGATLQQPEPYYGTTLLCERRAESEDLESGKQRGSKNNKRVRINLAIL